MTLTDAQMQCLNTLAEVEDRDFPFLNFRDIARAAGMERGDVRRAVRRLAAMGLAEFRAGLFTVDGEPYGSGYAATDAGFAALQAAEEAAAQRPAGGPANLRADQARVSGAAREATHG